MTRAKKATEAPTDPLDAMLARLQLSGIRDQLDSLLDEAARANLSARETLILLCEREIARKDHRRIDMALKLAHFPAVKELAGFDFEAQPSIDPKQIRDFAASRWIANGENVLLLGPPESDSYCSPRYAVIVQALFGADRRTAAAGSVAPARPS
ncbi:ATP-binding protein [Bradyrhizobium sp. 26S5]|uniref:ATP-binding protein n=1 Tax=Bradyrhizobium sp. 26S5 TaxID=3139729 RepID=UPI0039C86756